MQWDAGVADDLVERIWEDPNSLVTEGQTLQVKARCSVVRIDGYCGTFVWKRHTWGSVGRTIRRGFAPPVAKKCWINGSRLCRSGVPTPCPRLYLEHHVGPVNTSSYLLTDYIPGTSLYSYLRYGSPSEPQLVSLARQVAAIWQQLDDLHIQHNDFQTENFLVDPQGKLWLIDLERLRHCRGREELRRRQFRDIEDLLHPRNWRANPSAAELFRREIANTPAAIEAMAQVDVGEHPLQRCRSINNCPDELVSVVIPCRNAADTIAACLQSVRDLADEILVADAGSSDETLSIVHRFAGCRVVQHQTTDRCALEAWACAEAKHSWVLRVLPDEQVNAELSRELQILLASKPQNDAFLIARKCAEGGRVSKIEGVSSYRLFRKDFARFEMQGGEVVVVPRSKQIGRVCFPLLPITKSVAPLRNASAVDMRPAS